MSCNLWAMEHLPSGAGRYGVGEVFAEARVAAALALELWYT